MKLLKLLISFLEMCLIAIFSYLLLSLIILILFIEGFIPQENFKEEIIYLFSIDKFILFFILFTIIGTIYDRVFEKYWKNHKTNKRRNYKSH